MIKSILHSMITAVKKVKRAEEGQAIFEMIVFFPFIILLFTLIVTVGNAINGSINQQKATRAYFFYSIANDSMGTPLEDMQQLAGEGLVSSGLYAFGWEERSNGETPMATCYKMNRLLDSGNSETCDDPDADDFSTDFIRLYTAYGICHQRIDFNGANYVLNRAALGVSQCSVGN